MNGRLFFHAVRQRPVLYGIDGTYAAAVAFLLGFDAATNGGLLSGFREWLIVRIDDGNNLSWPALVSRVLVDRCSHGGEEGMCAACGGQAGAGLFDLLDEFLAVKERRNGMVKVFDAYLQWLRGQEWYRSDMLEQD